MEETEKKREVMSLLPVISSVIKTRHYCHYLHYHH